MEHDSSRSGYHEPEPGQAGRHAQDDHAGHTGHDGHSVNLIWAQSRSTDGRTGAIGLNGGMPWHLSEDLRHFKELTVSHPVIMGRRTWESFPDRFRPLPNRDNIVISRDPRYRAKGAVTAEDLEDAIDLACEEAIPDDGMDRKEIWVIGGARVFHDALAFADKAYITQIDAAFDADTFAPDLDALAEAGLWGVVDEGPWLAPADEPAIRRFRYVTYARTR